ncbi:MAG: hypothetical protein ACK521_02570 [bacterium]
MRKAFLDLDVDRNGNICSEDILTFFGGGSRFIDYDDLQKILEDVSETGDGNLNYFKFCEWMGSSIQDHSSLNFRHDSSHNPEFQEYFKGYNDRNKLNF